jgi:DNA recombination protein RmuC
MDSNVLIAVAGGAAGMTVLVILLLVMVIRTNSRSAQLSAQIASLVPALSTINDDTKRTSERITALEVSAQNEVTQFYQPISKVVNDLHTELAVLQTKVEHQQSLDSETAKSISRLEMIIAGTKSKGMAGEQIIGKLMDVLPAAWVVTNFPTNGGVVEFGLRFPGTGLVLPIDSKWPATSLLDAYFNSDDPAEQQKLQTQIEAAVVSQAKAVSKYLDPNETVNFGLAVVPDSVFRICSANIHQEAFKAKIVLISYSLLVPYLLMVFETVSASTQSIDVVKLSGYLADAGQSLDLLQRDLGGRMRKAITMLQNSNSFMSTHVSKLSTDLIGLQTGAGLPENELLTSARTVEIEEETADDRDPQPSRPLQA